MGDPRRLKKKYSGPSHMWEKDRIEEEKKLIKEYGLVNKKELWRANSKLKAIKAQAKKLLALDTEQSRIEKGLLLKKLQRLGLISAEQSLDDVLNLKIQDILNRRLQTIVLKKGLAKSIKQARQVIVHNHISLADINLTSPSYLVSVSEEPDVKFSGNSSFSDPNHPERVLEQRPKKGAKDVKQDAKKLAKQEIKKESEVVATEVVATEVVADGS